MKQTTVLIQYCAETISTTMNKGSISGTASLILTYSNHEEYERVYFEGYEKFIKGIKDQLLFPETIRNISITQFNCVHSFTTNLDNAHE